MNSSSVRKKFLTSACRRFTPSTRKTLLRLGLAKKLPGAAGAGVVAAGAAAAGAVGEAVVDAGAAAVVALAGDVAAGARRHC